MRDEEVTQVAQAYPDCGKAAISTAGAMRSYPERFKVEDVTADQLEKAGQLSDLIEQVERDAQAALRVVAQGRLLLDSEVHLLLRKMNSYVLQFRKIFAPRKDFSEL